MHTMTFVDQPCWQDIRYGESVENSSLSPALTEKSKEIQAILHGFELLGEHVVFEVASSEETSAECEVLYFKHLLARASNCQL